jgi:hypothetical protein
VEVIGEGGYGTVYMAEQAESGAGGLQRPASPGLPLRRPV